MNIEPIDWQALWLFGYGLLAALIIGSMVYLIRKPRLRQWFDAWRQRTRDNDYDEDARWW